ncbi:MAG TPA: DUF1801 domain-containing protein [Cyclobacteriaceae bacterium]|nr:DUF1801 domain-containing protein [Cyclobacteriaceae bacterium]HRW98073.1 DUF1801 domain-containing protein [Cyclobacteriaceae bacterium]
MAELKTKKNTASVEGFLKKVKDSQRKEDCFKVLELMKRVTGEKPLMWGSSIVGFGSYHYVYATGREGDWPLTGFSPRAQNLTLYIMPGFDRYDELMKRLGKFKTGKSCLYLKKLDDVDQIVLEKLISESVKYMKKKYKVS